MPNEPVRFPRVISPRRTGSERLRQGGKEREETVLDFWQWAASDVLENTPRGLLAEYLVALAVGADLSGVRDGWAAYDLMTPEGTAIEVKSAAYLQSWFQKAHSQVSFRIAKTKAWSAETGLQEDVARRQANVYVFALLGHKDKATVNPLDLDQWLFYAMSTPRINEVFGDAESVSLSKLATAASGPHQFSALAEAIRSLGV